MEWVIGLVVGAVVMELYAWLPKLCDHLIEYTVTRLPIESQIRYREEWLAHAETMPNSLTRAAHALTLLVASAKIRAIDIRAIESSENVITEYVAPVLTPTELTCLQWVAYGKSSWDIGMILNISENAVNFHIKNTLNKLEANNRTWAVVQAIRYGHITL